MSFTYLGWKIWLRLLVTQSSRERMTVMHPLERNCWLNNNNRRKGGGGFWGSNPLRRVIEKTKSWFIDFFLYYGFLNFMHYVLIRNFMFHIELWECSSFLKCIFMPRLHLSPRLILIMISNLVQKKAIMVRRGRGQGRRGKILLLNIQILRLINAYNWYWSWIWR